MGADCGGEAEPLCGGEVFPPVGIDEARVGSRGHRAALRNGCRITLRYSRGNDHRVDLPGFLRASLADDRGLGGASRCLKVFPNADFVSAIEAY